MFSDKKNKRIKSKKKIKRKKERNEKLDFFGIPIFSHVMSYQWREVKWSHEVGEEGEWKGEDKRGKEKRREERKGRNCQVVIYLYSLIWKGIRFVNTK